VGRLNITLWCTCINGHVLGIAYHADFAAQVAGLVVDLYALLKELCESVGAEDLVLDGLATVQYKLLSGLLLLRGRLLCLLHFEVVDIEIINI
jgi:hypothetical protein